tara:strand:+ start:264 stop:1223 length:960 start_codon:yes stop_codon:yes gene_type:complete
MSKNKLLFNSFISLIIVFFCLFIFINNLKEGIRVDNLLQHIYNGCIYIMFASILLILSVYLRAFRWKNLFQSNKFNSISDLFSAQLVGYFINNISPVRIGDFAKSYLVSKKADQKNSYILGSIMMERVLDTIMLFIFMLIIIYSYGLEYLNINFSVISIYNIIAVILISCFSIYCIKFFIPFKIKNILSEFWKGFTTINSSNKSAVIFSSIFIWLIYWMNVFLIQEIFPALELKLIDCLFILVASSFIQMIPTGFGGLGIFHLGVNSVLIKLDIPNYEYFLILLWLYSYFIYTTLGSYHFIRNGKFTIKNLYNDLIKNQ